MGQENLKPEPSLGIAWAEFEASVDVVDLLRQTGKFQLFLARETSIRIIGGIDEFRVFLAKKIGSETLEKTKAAECLREIQLFLQVAISTAKTPAVAANVFERNVYDDEFAAAKEDLALTELYRTILKRKTELIFAKFAPSEMADRAKRLSTAIGPALEDLDIEVISRRRDLTQAIDVDAPFLRLRLRYSKPNAGNFPFAFPAWLVNAPRNIEGFELECDETDIDLLVSRLLQAKELLRQAIDVKAEPS